MDKELTPRELYDRGDINGIDYAEMLEKVVEKQKKEIWKHKNTITDLKHHLEVIQNSVGLAKELLSRRK
jgi:hypothetical protein